MIFRDFRYVSAEAAYRGVKNVDFMSPLFAMARRGAFYITSVYILFGRKYIRRK